MSMTEKEAKEKLCPFAISGSWIAHNMNGCGAYQCDASDCMAWEWDFNGGHQIACIDIFAKDEPTRPDEVPSSWIFVPSNAGVSRFHAYWEQPPEENRDNWIGHCHLIFRGA